MNPGGLHLSPTTTMNTLRTDRFRIMVFFKKRPELSLEEFSRYWMDEHSKLVIKWMDGKEGMLKYEQLHVNQAEKARLKKMGVPILDYDGVALFDTDNYENFQALFNEEYVRDILPDEEKFVHHDGVVVIRANIASIIDHDEDLIIAAQMASAGSPYLKPPTKLRKDRSRMLFTFNVKEGADLSRVWLQDHAEVVKVTPIGQSAIKYEQLYPMKEPFGRFGGTGDAQPPLWDGECSLKTKPNGKLRER
ncbi:hypothetical protein L218DRAFT_157627 [Marasmius fiardii PR-910]|nr:hypothetical protein L218DRAFT_157627 [Marasmius fiardii PR-910]